MSRSFDHHLPPSVYPAPQQLLTSYAFDFPLHLVYHTRRSHSTVCIHHGTNGDGPNQPPIVRSATNHPADYPDSAIMGACLEQYSTAY